jgi:mono/diheme cytochrome c family protein
LATLWAGLFAAFCLALPALADEQALAKRFDEQIKPLLAQHCFECHAKEEPEGELRLDRLSLDFADKASREVWSNVRQRVKSGEMPPKEKPRLPEADVARLIEWIRTNVEPAEAAARAAQGRTVLRRLNRQEYQNTIRDLLAVDVDLTELLPEDTAAAGFDNVGEALHTSSFLMERYLDAADKALSVAIANLPQPPLVKKRYTMDEERIVKTTTESVYLKRDDALVMFSSSAWNSITVSQFYPPDRGKYRVQISCYGHQSGGKPVVFRIDAGPMLMATKNHMVDYFDSRPDEPAIVEFVDHFEARNHFRISPYGLATAHVLNKVGAEKYDGPGLAIQWIDVEGPLHESWPPESHRRIFGDMPQGPAPTYNYSKRVEVVSENPTEDAQRILKNFARRAFRRPVSDDDVAPLVKLVEAKMAGGYSFEAAMRAALKGVLVSPSFLFLREPSGQLDDFALASRLSYFLWSSLPDDELDRLAGEGRLSQPDVLRGQVERMLSDAKAKAFTENFVGQWLGLRDIDFTEPSHLLYPEYDEMLRESMVRETQLFFDELLKNDLSLANFVSSDFAMLNGRLAKHYGIPDVDGWKFRRVTLPPDSHRGGVLTMGSVLKVTANGTTTSPVMRGAWVLDRILGTPAPPPPAEVPVLEPDIRGATTIREQLAKHRQIDTCAACHAKIDPPGFALESFDVIGGYREHYRTSGSGGEVIVDGRRMSYHRGKPVDPADELADGRKFANIDELKQLLLSDKDQLARALTTRLLTYATAARPIPADQPQIDTIVNNIRDKDYGLRSLVHEIVQSEAFRQK